MSPDKTMEISDKDIKRFSVLFLVLLILILIFLLIKPIILSILGGLILAYMFLPIYKRAVRLIKSRNLSATLVSILVLAIIIVPLYFIIPVMINQVFEFFKYTKELNVQGIMRSIFPAAPESFLIQMTVTFDGLISKITSVVLNTLVDFLLNLPVILFNLVIVAFVFFFALRDSDKLGEFVSALSPLNKTQEKKVVQQFKDITNSVIYGQVVIGFVQGLSAGLGFLIFGIPHALLFATLAIILSIIPLIGPFIIWVPAVIYLFLNGNTTSAVIFLIYNVVIVSNIDNLLRIYILSKKTNLSTVIVLIGMIGGLFIFGILGLIIGPLLLAYFITFLQAYKENTLSSLFKSENA